MNAFLGIWKMLYHKLNVARKPMTWIELKTTREFAFICSLNIVTFFEILLFAVTA